MVDRHITDPTDREGIKRLTIAPLRRVDRNLEIGNVPTGAQSELQRLLFVACQSNRARFRLRRGEGLMENLDDRIDRPHRQLIRIHGRGFRVSGCGVQTLGQKGTVMFERAVRIHGKMELEHARIRWHGDSAEHRGPHRGAADTSARAEKTARSHLPLCITQVRVQHGGTL